LLTAVATTAVGGIDEDDAAGLGTEVDPRAYRPLGSITSFRPRRSHSALKASDHSSRA
jgi:hypothetical protein